MSDPVRQENARRSAGHAQLGSTALRWVVLVLALAILIPLGARPLSSPDEIRYAEISREMLARGDWIVPRLVGLRYFEKPVGGYWLTNLAQLVFGTTAFATRLSAALGTLVAAWCVGRLARLGTGDARSGWLAAAVYLSCWMVFGIGAWAVLDAPLSAALAVAGLAMWRAGEASGRGARALWWAAFGGACGAAFLIKGFVALAVAFVAFAPWWLFERRWRELLGYGPLAVLCAALVAAPWSLAIHAREPDFWRYFFLVEHVQRFASEDAQHKAPFWMYVPVLLVMVLPWTPLLPGTLRGALRDAPTAQRRFARFLLCWFALPFLFFSASSGKLATYVLPCAAPLAILMALHVQRGLASGRERALRVAAGLVAGLGGAGLVGLLVARLFFADREMVRGEGVQQAWVALACGTWLALGLLVLKRRLSAVLGLASVTIALGASASRLAPRALVDSNCPEPWMRELAAQPELAKATLASSGVHLNALLAYTFERTDVTLVASRGELRYGAEQPDARHRFVPAEGFPAWLAAERAQRGVLCVAYTNSGGPRIEYPAPTWERVRGTTVARYWAPTSGG